MYFLIAALATIVDMSFLYIFTEFLGIFYFFSAFMSYFLGMITNYSLNKIYNFKCKSKKIIRQFAKFSFVAGVGLVLNQIIIYTLVEFAKMWYMFAKTISVFIVLIWSYNGHKHITFRSVKKWKY